MSNNKLMETVNSEIEGVSPEKSAQIKSIFNPMTKMLEGIEQQYNQVIAEFNNDATTDTTVKARILRLNIAKVRIAAEKARKSEKEQYLRAGKAIDGFSNILKFAITEKEEKLKEIENYSENLEKQRLKELQSKRELLIFEYIDNGHEINLSAMETDVWESYLSTKKNNYRDKIEAEKQAEQIRQKQEDERIDALKKAREEELKRAKIEAKKNAERERDKAIQEEIKAKKELEELKEHEINRKKEESALAEKRRLENIKNEKIREERRRQEIKEAADNARKKEQIIIEMEKNRIIEAERARQKNIAHVTQIRHSAIRAIVSLGIDDKLATQIVKAISSGQIPNIAIKY